MLMSKYKHDKYYDIIISMKKENKTNKEILKAINNELTLRQLHKIILRLGLGTKKYKEKNRKVDMAAIKLISNGVSHRETAKILNLDQQTMSLRLRTYFNICPLPDGKKDVLNMFDVIDTEEKAYWLGMMYADGYVSSENKIELTLKDKEHIEKFKDFLKSDHKVSEKKVKTGSGIKTYYRISIKDNAIAESLIALGCVNAKSLVIKFPTDDQVPHKLLKDFIRGYVDGDGTICFGSGKFPQVSISIIGTKDFIFGYINYITKELDITCTNTLGRCGNNFYKNIGGNIKAKKIINHLYHDSCIYLDRKYKRYIKICRPN